MHLVDRPIGPDTLPHEEVEEESRDQKDQQDDGRVEPRQLPTEESSKIGPDQRKHTGERGFIHRATPLRARGCLRARQVEGGPRAGRGGRARRKRASAPDLVTSPDDTSEIRHSFTIENLADGHHNPALKIQSRIPHKFSNRCFTFPGRRGASRSAPPGERHRTDVVVTIAATD
ncbi:hypothetical protein CZ771_11285 [Actinomycetales bacterium JB111]|nr:hypothetical protein CZ771_11285 [Actinomycetales bacterium JB111]